MPFNGSGDYSPPAADFPAVTLTVISSSKYNNVINDIANALDNCVTRDGQSPATNNLPMGGFKLTGLTAGTAGSDSATIAQLQGAVSWIGTAGGTADAITLTPTPAIAAYVAGQEFVFKTGTGPNTTAVTVAVSGLTTKAVQSSGTALTAGMLAANQWYRITYDGTAFQAEQLTLLFGIPQNTQSTAYTTTMADANKHLLHPTADNNPRTFTIDSNANVAYPVGTCITFVNEINVLTIAITSDTLVLAGIGTTGSRTLAAMGIATALKKTATSWIISGVGLA